ncbi:hypothetical protein [Streptomyces sp. JB150]|uniref:hypothetical protein n=1 Tax=Streptomyces sp. JB150 TaxID=2714844 RepID=UPI001407A369|nr:hypothetical protein [Streptomyces sp. JB150]QIJ61434.1 hypothetical protein G7Z13_04830 [Streptomyces sp. JB150]
MQERLDRVVGWALLWWATLLHRTVAKQEQWHRWQARRNLALCQAEARGRRPKEIADRLGLSEAHVKAKIRDGRKVARVGVDAAAREAAAEEDAE